MNDAVLYESRDDIGLVTLNRPSNRNSMTAELLEAFTAAVAAARRDAAIRCVVITGSGSCFSAGADFKSMVQAPDGAAPRTPAERSYAIYVPFLSVLDIEVPVIAACNGHTVGGGFGLALNCDLRIGAKEARYGANFARLGLHSGMAISYTLPRLIGQQRAAELLFTGRLIEGDEAARLGLLLDAVPAADVLPRALELARSIADSAPAAVRAMKRTFYAGLGWDPRAGAWAEAGPQAASLASADSAEGIAALLEKRAPRFTGR
jgi:enoyl-CoA hydratase/carnithine racemase